jgi:four helix bundle protein
MTEFSSLDRCAAYVAARHALTAIHATVASWPPPLAEQAKRAAIEVVMTTAEGIGHDHASPARRRCLRAAIGSAIEVAAVVDVARAMGYVDLDRTQRLAGRSVAMLGLFLHASVKHDDDQP